MAQWALRQATTADAPALALCIDAAYEQFQTIIPDLPAVSEGIEDEIKGGLVWVAQQSGTIIGGLIMHETNEGMTLANVAVSPVAKGTGLGRALMEKAEKEARHRAYKLLKLATHVAMPQNVSLYQHLGWKEARRSGNKVHMEKDL